jgi:uncharacterized protein YjiS (DUF1127 family)
MQDLPRPFDPEGAALRWRALCAFVSAAMARWRRRSKTRRHLRALSERQLEDVALSDAQQRRESAKWFWQR